jgi:hypothetical protein
MPTYCLRGIGPPYPAQQDVIDYLMEPSGHIKKAVVQCGLGWGKTTLSIDIACRMLSMPFWTSTLFLEPDARRMAMIFWVQWRKIVPRRFYRIKTLEGTGQKYIEWKATGNCLYPAIRNITGNQQDVADAYRGIEFTNVIDDESAIKFNLSQYKNTFNRIRGDSLCRFYLNVTTPKAGSYSNLVRLPGVKMFYGHTEDNVYLMARHPTYIEDMAANMSRDEVRRELYGELIALEGRVFREALIDAAGQDGGPSENPDQANRWPYGNVHWDHSEFREGQPWWLLCDLGSATGAYTVIQSTSSRGRFRGNVWVACADYCSDSDASVSRAFQVLDREFGAPVGVCAGGDIQTRSLTDGSTVAFYVSQMWGNGCRIYVANESRASKMLQLDMMNRLICTSKGHRRFTVAKNFRSLDPDSRRGVRETLLAYVHKPIEEREEGYVIPKGRQYPLCHCSDSLLMGAVELMSQPQWLKQFELVG